MCEIIEVSDLSFRYEEDGPDVLKNVSFKVCQGEIVGIIGDNNSGKSTLCQIAAGLIPHYISGEMSGNVWIESKSTKDFTMGELAQKVGMVFQNPFNQLTYTTSTVRDELAFGLGNTGMARELMLEKVEETARAMRVYDILDKNPLQLSGGQIQRVALGSCLIMDPDILILDECCSQLDPMGSEEIFRIIHELKEKGITILIVDHDMERMASIADKLLVLHDGRVMAYGKTQSIFSDQTLREYIDVPEFTLMSEVLSEFGRKIEKKAITEEEIIHQINREE